MTPLSSMKLMGCLADLVLVGFSLVVVTAGVVAVLHLVWGIL